MGQSQRLLFQSLLEEALGNGNVYFQPPDDATMVYPCIVYERDFNASLISADNIAYHWTQRYQVTLIDPNPDSAVIDKLVAFPFSAFSRHFATSGLNHDVFVIYH
jgi:hypothetical protein